MRLNMLRGASLAAACALLVSCADKVNAPGPQVVGGTGAADEIGTPKVVISQVYGGSGGSGVIQNDFVELFNAGTASQSLTGWSVQYASATGTGNFGASASQLVALSGAIEPGQYYLVRLRQGSTTVGAPLPASDAGTNTSIDMSGTAGKVALVDQATTLGCNGGSTPCSDAQKARIVDLVGYGTSATSGANFFEGSSAAPTLSTANAALRKDHGCQDTNQNGADFVTAAPSPRNSLTTKAPCQVVVGPLADITVAGPTSLGSGSTITLTATLKDANGNAITDPAATFSWTSTDPAVASVQSTSGNTATILGGNGGTATINVEATSNGITRPASLPPAITVVGPLDHVLVTGATTVATGATIVLTATLKDAIDQTITDPAAQYTWTSADPATAEVTATANNTATIKGIVPGGPISISLSVTSNGVTKAASPIPAVTVTGSPVIVPSSTVVSEIHYDNNGTDANERIEIEGNAGASLDGWSLVLYNGNGGVTYNTIALSGIIPSSCTNGRGVIVIPFLVNGLQNGANEDGTGLADGWALVNAQNQVTEFRSYEGTFAATNGPASGLQSTAIDATEATPPTSDRSVQRAGNGVWFGPKKNSFNACNPAVPPPVEKIILANGKDLLALGMQTQFFFSGTDNSGNPVTSVTWSSSNTNVLTVDTRGIVTGRSLGTATLTATAHDGAIGTVEITVYIAPGSTGIRLGHNTEFGEPRDESDADDFLIRRPQYTVSYNPNRGGANWVSWNLSASHLGDVGRCPGTCYSADTALSNAGITAYTTADWTSGGVWDRGHMAPSADWTSSEADNNTTFFLTNFLPQAGDLNQGPWERMEAALRDSVGAGREIYVIAGGVFTNGVGLGKIQGKIAIPDSTWKIAVIMPTGLGIGAGGTLPAGTNVIAVNMPNVEGIRNVDWRTWLTSVAKIEASTGYNFLDLLSEPTECLVEKRNCAPTARITAASFSTAEGSALSFSGATSSDPNAGDVLAKEWFVNGASAGSGDTFDHTFPNDGTYEVKLIVTDAAGSNSTSVATVAVSNVAPVVGGFAGATILVGESYTAAGNFTDPGSDTWTGSVNFGDGSSSALSISGHSFSGSHTYTVAGTYTVLVTVGDGAANDSQTATVVVKSAVQGIADLGVEVGELGLNLGQANSLRSKLSNAARMIGEGKTAPAINMLEAFIAEIDAMAQSGRISPSSATELTAYARRLIEAI
jgi:DNA/RNA endonuclease G (NUC1)/uncharacterized protein YjdB